MKRREFPIRVKLAAFQRCQGYCENALCQIKLHPGRARYDHVIADGLTGEPTLENCQVLCPACHDEKTRKHDVPAIAKAKRRERKHAGIRKKSSFACSRDSTWKKKIDGTVVRR